MKTRYTVILISFVVLTLQPVQAQSWGQLKSQAQEAEAEKKYPEAIDYWKKALAGCKSESDPRYAQSTAGLAHTFAAEGKYAEADEYYKKLLDLAKPGSLSDDCKAALIDYKAVLRKQNRNEEAANLEAKYSLAKVEEPIVSQATLDQNKLKAEKIQQETELKNWQALIDGGSKDLKAKHYLQAEQQLKQALLLADKQGRNYKILSESLKKLVQLYTVQDKPALSEPYYQRSLVITRITTGAESKEYAHALTSHGLLLRKLNRKTEAMAEEAKAERILAKLSGENGGSSGGSSSPGQVTSNTSGTRTGALLNRARSASSGFNEATNQAINSPE